MDYLKEKKNLTQYINTQIKELLYCDDPVESLSVRKLYAEALLNHGLGERSVNEIIKKLIVLYPDLRVNNGRLVRVRSPTELPMND